MSMVELSKFNNSWYRPGGSLLKRIFWMLIGQPLFSSYWLPGSACRVFLLRLFGAKIGRSVVIKPRVFVKYPWHLEIGDHSWIGEESWIDNLTKVEIHQNVCVSQGAYLGTGNHDWTDPYFALRIAPVRLEEGSWAAAKSLLTPGAVLGRYAIATAGSVIVGNVPEFAIYSGNPARFVKTRNIRNEPPQFEEVAG